ncbi:MAG: hypothetical protein KAR83_02295 [Thermodesulfovibrionales bacterium]|nr:hypothetical protein [Thermodesulfovibrionales bacterium]
MAKEIKPTPTLSGEDAKAFLSKIKASENTTASEEENKELVDNYNEINKYVRF